MAVQKSQLGQNCFFTNHNTSSTLEVKSFLSFALRPLLACKYIEETGSIPPVRFEELLEQKLDERLYSEIMEMLEIKAQSDEKALNSRMPQIHKYIEDEIAKFAVLSQSAKDDRNADWNVLNRIFREICVGE